jgi:superfamily I DNA and/or RNA helicase
VDDYPPHQFLDGTFNVDMEAPTTTFDRAEKAIRNVQNFKPSSEHARLRDVLFGLKEPEFRRLPEVVFLDQSLNEPQHDAVRLALAADQIALIHGPPGTGKTTTLVEVVRQEVARGNRVLVTAASNAAVDHLGEKLHGAGVSVVRLGHPARVMPALEHRTLDALLEATPDYALVCGWQDEGNQIIRRANARRDRGQITHAERRQMVQEARQLLNDARNHLRNIQKAILANTPVILATAAGADSSILESETFDVVVLDEATQVTKPMALVALQRAPRAVMAGDPHQLPPTVISGSKVLDQTFFDALHTTRGIGVMLTVQHRMHQDIMTFPSESKYEGRLIAAEHVAQHSLDDFGVEPNPSRGPLTFIDTAGKGWDENTSQEPSLFNPEQAERVIREVQKLITRGVRPDQISVITPYDAQAKLLRKKVMDGVEVSSIDGFQGRENEVIIVDLVRSNPESKLGFLKDTRRLNVALTRAKRHLLVIGDSATLGGDVYFDAFFRAVEDVGSWESAWADDA